MNIQIAAIESEVVLGVFCFDSEYFREQLAMAVKVCGTRKSNYALLERVLEDMGRVRTVGEHMRFLAALELMVQLPFGADRLRAAVKTKYSQLRKQEMDYRRNMLKNRQYYLKDLHLMELLARCFGNE